MITIDFSAHTAPSTLAQELQGKNVAMVYAKHVRLAQKWDDTVQRVWERSECAVVERKPLQDDASYAHVILHTASLL